MSPTPDPLQPDSLQPTISPWYLPVNADGTFPPQATFATIVSELGGLNKLDLTSDVTHLLVGSYDTPKYKYVAKRRPDVKCVLPDWLVAVRDEWREGKDADVEGLEEMWRLPVFHGMVICLTGFSDIEQRKQIECAIREHGGEYAADLTRAATPELSKPVTHLIANAPKGAKYLAAKKWQTDEKLRWNGKIVAMEWIDQSLERGMVLEEKLYDPTIPVEERGKGAIDVQRKSPTKRAREDETAATTSAPARKLRRTASARFSSQNDAAAIWTDIVEGGFAPQEVKKKEWGEGEDETLVVKEESGREIPSLPLPIPQAGRASVQKPSAKGFFHGKRFYIHGFGPKQVSRSATFCKRLLTFYRLRYWSNICGQTTAISYLS